jgi:branched-chain amino acid transport system ATP-binding protein
MALLRTRGLTRRFGGVTAVDDVDFALGDELCALIGPNGAGKTTFFDLLTGVLAPTAGRVERRVDGEWRDLTDAGPAATAGAGVHRSYQVTNLFPGATVRENVRIAAQAAGRGSWRPWRNVRAFPEHYRAAEAVLDRVGLAAAADRPAGTLSHGEKRSLEVAVALAGDPDVLLLDEPAAGVSSESLGEVVALVEDVARDHAVLLVEHNVDLVMDVSDRVVVLHQGAVIADDDPAAVRADETVQRAYLGGYGREGADDGGDRRAGAGDGGADRDQAGATGEADPGE